MATYMTQRHFKLSMLKTKFMIFPAQTKFSSSVPILRNGPTIHPSSRTQKLGCYPLHLFCIQSCPVSPAIVCLPQNRNIVKIKTATWYLLLKINCPSEKEQIFPMATKALRLGPNVPLQLHFSPHSLLDMASFQSLKCNRLPTCTGPLYMLVPLPEVPSPSLSSYFPFRIQINHTFLHLTNSYWV